MQVYILVSLVLFVGGTHAQGPSASKFCNLCQLECANYIPIASLKADIEELKQATKPVAFYAYLSSNLALGSVKPGDIIKYDKVDLNVETGYSAATGKFTAPVKGLYNFHVTTGVRDRSHSVIELVKGNVVKDVTWADSMDHVDRAVASTSTPMLLNKGEQVWVRIGKLKGGAVLESTVNIRCSFSGVKL